MRIGIIALQHESNTFLPDRTDYERFAQDNILTAEAIRELYGPSFHEVGGFFEGLDKAGLEAVPIFTARATPAGVIPAETLERLESEMLAALDAAGPLDGLLVAPHGAGVSETHRDADGHWLSLVRDRVGPDMPIICTIDPHANVSSRMIAACDATIAYRTNPHLDQRDRGLEAAALMARTVSGEVKPAQGLCAPPLQINIERQRTAKPPCLWLHERAEVVRQMPGVLSVSVVLGFPYADVEEMGSAFIVVTDNDADEAGDLAARLGGEMWQRREDFRGQLLGIEAALDRAVSLEGPVGLLDMGDNVGGGGPADSTHLAHAIVRREIGPALVCLFDRDAVDAATKAGVGGRIEMPVGGKTDRLHGAPLDVKAVVRGIYDGEFTESEARHGGKTKFSMGPTAVVETEGGLTILLNSRRTSPFSLGQVTSCGLDPKAFRLIVIKGVHAPAAAYEPVCPHMIHVNTAGVTTADMEMLTYHHRRRPMYPFEPDTAWSPVPADL